MQGLTHDLINDTVGQLELMWDGRTEPDHGRVLVMADLTYLSKYGRNPMVELMYGCSFEVKVGDLVVCPPTPRGGGKTFIAMVSSTDTAGHPYKGRVKQLIRRVDGPATDK